MKFTLVNKWMPLDREAWLEVAEIGTARDREAWPKKSNYSFLTYVKDSAAIETATWYNMTRRQKTPTKVHAKGLSTSIIRRSSILATIE